MDNEDIREAIEYVLNEAHLHPDDSLVDIANEVFFDLGFTTKWSNDDTWPISVKRRET